MDQILNSIVCASCSLRLHIPCVQTFRHCLQDHVLAWICQQLHQPHNLPLLQPGVQESFSEFTGSSLSQNSPEVAASSSENSSESNSGSQPDSQPGPGQQGGGVPPQPFLVYGPVSNAVLQGQQGVEGLFRRRNGRIGTRSGQQDQGGQTLQQKLSPQLLLHPQGQDSPAGVHQRSGHSCWKPSHYQSPPTVPVRKRGACITTRIPSSISGDFLFQGWQTRFYLVSLHRKKMHCYGI